MDVYHLLWIVLGALLLVSAFFSGSETGMMSVNRYRLRHAVENQDRTAVRIENLIRRPDRLLGVILLGNTFANLLASSVATVLAIHYWGDHSIWLVTLLLTVMVLIFAEVMPKTYAAMYPEQYAGRASLILLLLQKCFSPVLWIVNKVANNLLLLFRVKVASKDIEAVSADELYTLVNQSGAKISPAYQDLLLRILRLEKCTVNDVMLPKSEVVAINTAWTHEEIALAIREATHRFLPVYTGSFDAVLGVLDVKLAVRDLLSSTFSVEKMLRELKDMHYVPEGTVLTKELAFFQREKIHIALVCSEYGEVLGLITLTDILEEMVGEVIQDVSDVKRRFVRIGTNKYRVDGGVYVRDLNRELDWSLPCDGPKTVSGLVVEALENIPTAGVGVEIGGYCFEVLSVGENQVRAVSVMTREGLND